MKMDRKYVVIGSNVASYGGATRTQCESEDEATAHARYLIQSQNQKPGTELWVVEVKRVVRVERPEPPITIIPVD